MHGTLQAQPRATGQMDGGRQHPAREHLRDSEVHRTGYARARAHGPQEPARVILNPGLTIVVPMAPSGAIVLIVERAEFELGRDRRRAESPTLTNFVGEGELAGLLLLPLRRRLGLDRNLRERFRAHEWFRDCAEFCEKYDQNSFDAAYDTLPLEAFEPAVRKVFAAPRRSLYMPEATG